MGTNVKPESNAGAAVSKPKLAFNPNVPAFDLPSASAPHSHAAPPPLSTISQASVHSSMDAHLGHHQMLPPPTPLLSMPSVGSATAAGDLSSLGTVHMNSAEHEHDPESQAVRNLFVDSISVPPPRISTYGSLTLPSELAALYAAQAATTMAAVPPSDAVVAALPKQYVRVLPLDSDRARRRTTGSFGFLTSTLKVTSTRDGVTYAIRRVDGINAPKSALDRVFQNWRRLASQPSIVALRGVFMAKAGPLPGSADSGSGMALFFEHDYVPGAMSLHQRLMGAEADKQPVPEPALWSWAGQLALGVSGAHSLGVAFRCISPRHVLLSEFQRVRLTGAGVVDVLEMESPATLQAQQASDMRAFGELFLQASCREELPDSSAGSDAAVTKLLEQCKKQYSEQWVELLSKLLFTEMSAADLVASLGPSMAVTLNQTLSLNDTLHGALGVTHASSRLLRTIVKLSQVTERAEHCGDPSWAETGERYSLKLFRDFVFHQVDEQGRPVLDVGHVVEALSRLDVGDGTPVMLSSRDGDNLLVASYATLARNLNAAYNDLATSQGGPSVDSMAAAAGEEARAARRRERAAMHNMHSLQGGAAQPSGPVNFQRPQQQVHAATMQQQQFMAMNAGGAFAARASQFNAGRFNTGAPAFDG